MRMPRVPAMIMRLPSPVRISMPVAMLMRVNNASCVLMRMGVYFVVPVVIRIVAHLFHYQPLLYSHLPLRRAPARRYSATLITHFDN